MSKSRLFVLAVGLAMAIGVIVLILALSNLRHPEFHARSRLKLDPNGPSPFFFQDELQTMSNLLSSSESRLALSKMSEVSEPRFSLQQVGPIRGTKFVRLEYRGTDPNAVKW